MNDLLMPKILGTINVERLSIGKVVVIKEDVLITGLDGPAKMVVLGDCYYISRRNISLTQLLAKHQILCGHNYLDTHNHFSILPPTKRKFS